MLYMFRAVSPHIIRSSRTVHSIWYVLGLLAVFASVVGLQLEQQAWHVPDAVCTVLELLMMGGENGRNM
jgi:predicted Na+-dependent transporter